MGVYYLELLNNNMFFNWMLYVIIIFNIKFFMEFFKICYCNISLLLCWGVNIYIS